MNTRTTTVTPGEVCTDPKIGDYLHSDKTGDVSITSDVVQFSVIDLIRKGERFTHKTPVPILDRAQTWLKELGIRAEYCGPQLRVSRDDMVNLLPGTWESQYEEILTQLKQALKTQALYWSGKDDNDLFLETYDARPR